MPDHVHLLLSIPPKTSVSSFMGYLKGKSALMMFDNASGRFTFSSVLVSVDEVVSSTGFSLLHPTIVKIMDKTIKIDNNTDNFFMFIISFFKFFD